MNIATVGDNCMDDYAGLGRVFPGGNPVNVAVYSVRLGARASYTGVVGDDEHGRIMRAALAAKGVDTSHVHTLPGRTAVTRVELKDGERVFGDYDEGVLADFRLSDDDVEFLCGHDIVVTGLWGKVEGELHRIKARGVPVAFDFATKLDDPVVAKAIASVDYAFFAYDEGDDAFIRDYMIQARAKGPRLVVVTLGERGSVAYDGARFTTFGVVPCEVVDTMGAGDSYIAGFIEGLLRGEPLAACMRAGAESASETLRYTGAW